MADNIPIEYSYDMRHRPPDFGTHPMDGLLRMEFPANVKFGRLIYNRKLTADEVYSYELIPVNTKNQETKSNFCDDRQFQDIPRY